MNRPDGNNAGGQGAEMSHPSTRRNLFVLAWVKNWRDGGEDLQSTKTIGSLERITTSPT